MLPSPRPRDLHVTLAVSFVALAAYVVAFPFLVGALGEVAAAVAVIPVAVIGLRLGARAGILAGAVAIVVNVLLFGAVRGDLALTRDALVGGLVTVFVGGIVGRQHDLTRRAQAAETAHRRTRDALEARERDLARVVGNIPALVFRVGEDWRIETVAGGALASIDLDTDTLVGRDVRQVLGSLEGEHDRIRALVADALTGLAGEVEAEWGGRAWALRAEPVRDRSGRIVAAGGMAVDITAQHEHQVELEALLHRQREANERLESLNAMKDGFLQAVSHELRTPLTSVRGFAATLSRHRARMSSDHADLLFERLLANANKLDRLLNDLLDVDRLQRGIIEPRRTPVEVGRVACEVADSLELGSRRLTLDVEDVTVWVDGPKVERIVENLVGNAVKHTPEGTHLTLVVAPTIDGVRIEVRQVGVPVPDELKQVIFQPFRQGPLRTEHQPGTGIGLSLVARFAELHDGRAWVQDTLDGGAAFCVELLGEPVEAPTSAAPAHAPAT